MKVCQTKQEGLKFVQNYYWRLTELFWRSGVNKSRTQVRKTINTRPTTFKHYVCTSETFMKNESVLLTMVFQIFWVELSRLDLMEIFYL